MKSDVLKSSLFVYRQMPISNQNKTEQILVGGGEGWGRSKCHLLVHV